MTDSIERREFGLPHRTITGSNTLPDAAREAARFGRKAFVGCGRSAMRKHGTLDRLLEALREVGIEAVVFDEIEGNPST
ncbi:MAG: hypothetical protein DRH24_19230, partial [Deltaproteobacteria bacterium]